MSEGFTKSYRAKWNNPVFRNLVEAAVWAWMCDTAAWNDTKVRFQGELVNLKRGQLITSRRFISEGFCLGEQVTRTFLENLENEGMINPQPTHRGTIITICNYEKYQSLEIVNNPQTNQQPTSSQPTANPNKKEVKNLRREEYTSAFLDLWDAYPRRVNKKGAFKAYEKALKTADHETILSGAKQYAAKMAGKDEQYIAHLGTWLNGERWADEPPKKLLAWEKPENKGFML